MNIHAILERIRPGEEWSLNGNEYNGLVWLSSTRKPTFQELEEAWPEVQAEIEAQRINEEAKVRLAEIDLKSIRSIREWIAKQTDAPQYLKDYEAQAIEARAKLGKM
jgi:hypothetical protein